MGLSTVYRNAKAEENVCAKFVAQIDIDGSTITLTDVMGDVTRLEGHLVSADLTAGVVIVAAA